MAANVTMGQQFIKIKTVVKWEEAHPTQWSGARKSVKSYHSNSQRKQND